MLTYRQPALRGLLRRIRRVALGGVALVLACADSAPRRSAPDADVGVEYAEVVRKRSIEGTGTTTTTVREYTRGTLIVDVWDARTNKLVWARHGVGHRPGQAVQA